MKSNTVFIKVHLKHPFGESLGELFNFAAIWKCLVIESATYRRTATIAMPVSTFIKIFGSSPRKGQYNVEDQVLKEFIDILEVLDIKNA